MSVAACAEIVRLGDPDRFLAAMAAPLPARAVLFPIYAFNVEVARAPWVSAEPLIGEMRLQWWRDAVDEIAEGRRPRAHDVVVSLADVVARTGLPIAALDRIAAAHRCYLEPGGFDAGEALDGFLEDTGAGLMWASAAALGAEAALEGPIRALGWASGLAGYLRAIPEFEARGQRPLPDGRPDAVRALARRGLARRRAALKTHYPKPVRAALLAGWRTGVTLSRAEARPSAVASGDLAESEFRRRFGLLCRAFAGTV